MSLVEKGERNLKLARILETDEFCELSKFQKEHLCSVIINRLYYGVYLIAKGKLVEKELCKPTDRILHSGKDCVWNKLREGNENCFNDINLAHQLRNMRNQADYQEDNVSDNEIDTAKGIAQRLSQTLRRL